MPRVTHVKAAQQRYKTVPVIDPETGQAKVVPVMRNGVQRVTKRGKPVTMRLTVEDRTQPLPPENCDACRKPIEVGTPYKWIKPKSGPYGGRKRSRHESCPTWQPWDYSNSLSARTAQIAHEFSQAIADVTDPDDVRSALEAAAESIREIAEEKRESAQNIEDGFGHATSQSEELAQMAEDLDSWADEVEQATVSDLPEPEECDECDGTGQVENPEYDAEKAEGGEDEQPGYDEEENVTCDACGGEGRAEEPTEDQIATWREEVEQECSIVDECPV